MVKQYPVAGIHIVGFPVVDGNQVAKAGVEVIGVADLPAHPWRT